MKQAHYSCVGLSFSKTKSATSAPNAKTETVRDAKNECNDVPCVR